jgi:hypothetical protein
MPRILIVVIQAIGIALLAFSFFAFTRQFPQFVLEHQTLNICAFAIVSICLLIFVRGPGSADIKHTAVIGFMLTAGSVLLGLVIEGIDFGDLIKLSVSGRSGLGLAFGYAFLTSSALRTLWVATKRANGGG